MFYCKWVLWDAGAPQAIISDRGAVFTSKFWSSLCYFLRIKRKLSTAFHLQTDRQTEHQNQTLEQYLRAYVAYQQDDWGTWLPMAKFTYNNSFHPTLGCSPFYALQGADLAIQQWLIKEMDANIPAAKEWAEAIATMRADVEVQWVHTWCTQAIYMNWKTKPQVFNM